MRAGNELRGAQLIEALNGDIEREFRIADEHIARAMAAANLGRRSGRIDSSACAAAAMRHATALAAEVLHLGGMPPSYVPRETPRSRDGLARASELFHHYRERLRMANALGLLRLEEVLREIIEDLAACSRTRSVVFRWIRIS